MVAALWVPVVGGADVAWGALIVGLRGAVNKLGSSIVFGFDGLFVREEAREEMKVRDGIHEALYLDASAASLDRVDSKAGSLLTHISMMIAVATFVVASAETSWLEQFIIGAEIFVYLRLALCCLRCLVFVDVPEGLHRLSGGGDGSFKSLLREQAIIRGGILNVAIRWTFVVTFVFALSLAAHLVL